MNWTEEQYADHMRRRGLTASPLVADVPPIIDRPFGAPLTRHVTVELPGAPKGKGRPRFSMQGHAYTPKPTRDYESDLKFAAERAMNGAAPIDAPLRIEVIAYFSIPRSWSKKKQAAALAGAVRPTGKPDGDNVLKSVGDALNGVVWRDDSLIVTAQVSKTYSIKPRLWIQVDALFSEAA